MYDHKAYMKAWHLKNKEHARLYRTSHYDLEAIKLHRQEPGIREAINKSRRIRYSKNREKEIAATKSWQDKNKDFVKLMKQSYRHSNRDKINASNRQRQLAGKLSMEVIQIVYENNIKRYGTLTCYLCSSPVAFGKDHLEHKIPLSRGGTNEQGNLDVSCQGCNLRKHDKTEDEYRKAQKCLA